MLVITNISLYDQSYYIYDDDYIGLFGLYTGIATSAAANTLRPPDFDPNTDATSGSGAINGKFNSIANLKSSALMRPGTI